MIPEHLKTEYWKRVRDLLIRQHQLSPDDAAEAIDNFRDEGMSKTGEMVFHAEPEDTAKAVKAYFHQRPQIVTRS